MIDVVYKVFMEELTKVAMDGGPMVPHYAPPAAASPVTKGRVIPAALALGGLAAGGYALHRGSSALKSKDFGKSLGKLSVRMQESFAKGRAKEQETRAKADAKKLKEAQETVAKLSPKSNP